MRRLRSRVVPLGLAAVALLLTASACRSGGSTGQPPATTGPTKTPTSSSSTPATTPAPTPSGPTGTGRAGHDAITKVLVVIEENHSLTEMSSQMPYLFGLSEKYGYAKDWTAITHPSLPNYLAIASGSTFGVTDDEGPAAHAAAISASPSVFDQAIAAGKRAGTYAQSMPSSCDTSDAPAGSPIYAARHNPWVYFASSRAACLKDDVPLTAFAAAAKSSALPNVGFLIPDLCSDAHNCPLTDADAFLQSTLPVVLASKDFTSGKLVVVVTADEDDKKSGNVVLTSVLSTHLHGKVVDSHLTHYSLTRYIAEVLGVEPLGNGATAPDMKAAFGL